MHQRKPYPSSKLQRPIRLRWRANNPGGVGSSSGGEHERLNPGDAGGANGGADSSKQNGDVVVVKKELNGTRSNELVVPSATADPKPGGQPRERRLSSCGAADSTNPRSHSTRRIRYCKY